MENVGSQFLSLRQHGLTSRSPALLPYLKNPPRLLPGLCTSKRTGDNAGWDRELLERELKELSLLGADLEALGFTAAELNQALGRASINGLTDEDEVPELQQSAISKHGDVWCLGEHRLACGDCTDPDLVGALIGGAEPNLMVTDPPYGVSYDPAWRHRSGLNQSKRTGSVRNDHRADWREAWRLFRGNIAYVWHGALHAATVAASLEAEGFHIRSQIVWAKPRLVIGRGDYHWQHEPCWYAVRDKGNWTGDRHQTTLWTIAQRDEAEDTETTHGTQKPVECMRRPIQNNSLPGDVVYEPFSGSGTTLIAAETSKRICFAVELDPRYVDIAFLGPRGDLPAFRFRARGPARRLSWRSDVEYDDCRIMAQSRRESRMASLTDFHAHRAEPTLPTRHIRRAEPPSGRAL